MEEVLIDYLVHRGPVHTELNREDREVTPLICNIAKGGKVGSRISRVGLNYIVDGYLSQFQVLRLSRADIG